jgi:hypothetical protein
MDAMIWVALCELRASFWHSERGGNNTIHERKGGLLDAS